MPRSVIAYLSSAALAFLVLVQPQATRAADCGIVGLNAGIQRSRVWVDFNGDGFKDFCRIVSQNKRNVGQIQCTMSTGPAITDRYCGVTISSEMIDLGYLDGVAWADINGDQKADYCRLVGSKNHKSSYVKCLLAAGSPEGPAFGNEVSSDVVDWGYAFGRSWVDFNGDGKADYCRLVGSKNLKSSYVKCLLATGSPNEAAFGNEVMSPVLDWGIKGTQEWIDINLDQRADFCRIVGKNREIIACTVSNGDAFGKTFTDLVKPK